MDNKTSASKSAEIRRTARKMVSEGKPPRPKEIVARLKAEGVEVLSSLVSTALRDTPFALRNSRTNWEGVQLLPDPLDAIRQTSRQNLSDAEEFVRKIGSLGNAIAALVALSQFKEPEPEQQHGRA